MSLSENAAPARRTSRRAAFEPSALRRHRLFESNDVDDTRERISRVMQPHDLVPVDRLRGAPAHMDFARIGRVGFGAIRFGESMHVDVGAIDDYHLLMFCLSGHAAVRVDGQRFDVDAGHGMICAPEKTFSAQLSADCEQFVVRLDREAVESHTGRAGLRFASQLSLDGVAIRPWLEQIGALVTSPAAMDRFAVPGVATTEMERLLVALLVAGQPVSHESPINASGGASQGYVQRAEDWLHGHVDEAVTLADIAAAAGVPPRTLLEGFQRLRGTSPIRYLRDLRLDRARARLMLGHGPVARVAFDAGFAHLGRFSAIYQGRYGEAPSATLRRV
ncbi:AraC family transcriptional regulator [soil metagenome]